MVGRRTIKWWRCKDEVAVEYKERVTAKYEELSEEVGGLEEDWKSTKKHLSELQRSYVEKHQERAECQGVVTKDGGQARLQRQYAKRRNSGKKLRRPRNEEINWMQG